MTIVLAIVTAGTGVALFFRQDASLLCFWKRGADDPFGRPVERRLTPAVTPLGSATSVRSDGGGRVQRVPAAAAASISPRRGLGHDKEPMFQRNLSPVGALLPPIEGVVDEDELATFDDFNSPHDRPFAPASEAPRHVVVDGDTLSKLAERYLGRADGYLQIYEFNRDVLASPDLLPIGAELKIPPRSHPGETNEPGGIAHSGAPGSGPPLRMVPPRP